MASILATMKCYIFVSYQHSCQEAEGLMDALQKLSIFGKLICQKFSRRHHPYLLCGHIEIMRDISMLLGLRTYLKSRMLLWNRRWVVVKWGFPEMSTLSWWLGYAAEGVTLWGCFLPRASVVVCSSTGNHVFKREGQVCRNILLQICRSVNQLSQCWCLTVD